MNKRQKKKQRYANAMWRQEIKEVGFDIAKELVML